MHSLPQSGILYVIILQNDIESKHFDIKKYFPLYRDLIDRPRIMLVMEHDARFVHLEIFERLKMPPRLLAHLTLVHDAETKVKIDNSAFFVDKFRPMPYNLELWRTRYWRACVRRKV